jgi:hypothetical protein
MPIYYVELESTLNVSACVKADDAVEAQEIARKIPPEELDLGEGFDIVVGCTEIDESDVRMWDVKLHTKEEVDEMD